MNKQEAREYILAVLQGDEPERIVDGWSWTTAALDLIGDHELTRHFQAWADTPEHHVRIRRSRRDIILRALVGKCEAWKDSKGRVAYVKGWKSDNRISKHELKEAQIAKKVTLPSGVSFYPPFKIIV